MPSIDWDGLGLSRRYMRKAREEADKFLGNDPPLWDKLGMDTRLEKVGSYLEHLRKTDNSYIAEKLLSDENAAMELLRQKIKYIRNTKKKALASTSSASPTPVPREEAKHDSKDAEDTSAVGDRHEAGEGGTN